MAGCEKTQESSAQYANAEAAHVSNVKSLHSTCEIAMTDEEEQNQPVCETAAQTETYNAEFDVFLAYNSQDREQVLKIADALKRRGIKPWIDVEQILPGRLFQDIIQLTIPKVKTAAIIIGGNGLGDWQLTELRTFVHQCVKKGLPVMPVLLPGVADMPENALFLEQFNWVKFEKDIDEKEALDNLEWGITEKHPGRGF